MKKQFKTPPILFFLVFILTAFATISASAAGYEDAVQADGPVVYYRFNDTVAAPDQVTAANSGSLGAAADATYFGDAVSGDEAPRPPAFPGFEADNAALQLDGDGDYVGSMMSLLNGKPEFTLSGWIRRGGDQTSRTGLFGQNDKIEFGYIDNDTIQAWTDNGLDVTPNPFPNGEWSHLALVGEGTTMTMYTNGVAAGSRTYVNQPDNTEFFNVGGGGIFDTMAANGNYFQGQIDEVAIFDKPLSADQIALHYFSTVPSPPIITTQPEPFTTVFVGADVTLSVEVVGSEPLTYQWLDFGFPIDGETGPELVFENIQELQGSIYQVEVSNEFGTVLSEVAEIQVLPSMPPTIVTQPSSLTRYEGGTATFEVEATGSLILEYQWQANGADIPGETESTLTGPVTADLDGVAFTVVVSTDSGTVTSDPAILTVLVPTPGSYEDIVLSSGPVAFWRLGETGTDVASDYVNGNDGTYVNVTQGVPGAITGDSDGAAEFDGVSSYVTTVPGLLNGLTEFSMTGWIKRNGTQSDRAGLFGQNDFYEFGYSNDQNIQGWPNALDVGNSFQDGDWSHLAVTIGGGVSMIYTNGQLAGTGTYGMQADNTYPLNIGGGGIFDDIGANGNYFLGQIDDVAIYERALTADEVGAQAFTGIPSLPIITTQPEPLTTVFEGATVTLSVEVIGTPPFSYQWLDFGFPLDGETGSELTFVDIQELEGSLYQVEISNAQGSVVSDVAEIVVLPSSPPVIDQDPQSVTRYAGATVSFTVVASGSVDLDYQWRIDGVNIPGATEAVLTLSDIDASNQGAYSAQVSNASGSVDSADATLTVLVPEDGSYEDVIVSGNPIAFYRLNETEGDVAHDYVGGNDATYFTVTQGVPGAIEGDSDTAAEFDGIASYVAATPGLLNGLEDFSLSGWIKRNGDQNNRTGLFGQDNKVEFGYIDNDTIQAWTDSGLNVSPNPIPNDEWGHLVLVGDGGVMRLYINGVESGSRDYITQADNDNTFNIGGGGIFDVSGNYFNGAIDEIAVYDRALSVDEVTEQFFTAMPSAPIITAQPQGVDVFEGEDVVLSVSAIGNQPLTYQWLLDGVDIAGATDSTLEFLDSQISDSGSYSVRVSNPLGDTVSDVAVVNVMPNTPPVITEQPQPVVRYAGLTATFSVQATGGLASDYQWQANGENIEGATEPVLTGIATADLNGVLFRVIVSNAIGDTPSDEVLLTVIVPEPDSYESAVIDAGPIAYWRLNETSGDVAFDYAGDNHGSYNNVTQGVEGIVEGDSAAEFNGTSSSVTTTPVLNGLEDFTMTGWILRLADQNNRTGLFGQDNKVEFGYINNDTLQAWTDSGLDVSPNPFPNGDWSQVSLVSEGGIMTMYTNGLAAASRTHITQGDNDNTFNIGGGGIFDTPDRNGNWFNGQIDEVAVFDRALSGAELLNLFELGVPPNRPPVCSDGLASTDEDTSVDITLVAMDPDNDPLVYSLVDLPANGSASLSGNVVNYSPNPDYNGPDSFTFTVVDPEGLSSGVCTVSITVIPVNDPPVAVIEVSPLSDLGPTAPGLIMISANNDNVCAFLDGTGSYDIEGDAIESYTWLVDGVEVGNGEIIDTCLLVGVREVTLLVDDGQDVGESTVVVEVLTGSDAIEELIMVVNDSVIERSNKRPFIATLKTAAAGFDRGSFGSALNRLNNAFINKVRAQVSKDNPDEAAEWIRIAEEIVGASEREQACDCGEEE